MSDTTHITSTTAEYEVGYGKPPKATQFKKGQSGNPKGRPKGTKNFKTDLIEELSEQILVTEGGKDTTMSKQRAIVKRTMQKALTGDMRAITTLVGWITVFMDIAPESDEVEQLSPEDNKILEQFIADLYSNGERSESDEDMT